MIIYKTLAYFSKVQITEKKSFVRAVSDLACILKKVPGLQVGTDANFIKLFFLRYMQREEIS